jgi:hypothetical protein
MVDGVLNKLKTAWIDKPLGEAVKEALEEYWTNSIALVWTVSDVVDRAAGRGIAVTEEQALEILHVCHKRHDANQGINWVVIDCHTDWILQEPA